MFIISNSPIWSKKRKINGKQEIGSFVDYEMFRCWGVRFKKTLKVISWSSQPSGQQKSCNRI